MKSRAQEIKEDTSLLAADYRDGMAHVKVPIPTARYMNDLFRLRCAPGLLATGYYPNAKEFSESSGAYRAAVRHLPAIDLDDRGVIALVVGDGNTPRTGAMFAFRSAWTAVSVDPRLKTEKTDVQRLYPIKAKIEEAEDLREWVGASAVVVVAVHSHASLPAAVERAKALSGHVACIAMPCCVRQDLAVAPDGQYEDWGVLSPKRTIKVWRRL